MKTEYTFDILDAGKSQLLSVNSEETGHVMFWGFDSENQGVAFTMRFGGGDPKILERLQALACAYSRTVSTPTATKQPPTTDTAPDRPVE